MLAAYHYRNAQYQQALAILTDYLQKNPEREDLRKQAADIMLTRKDYQNAAGIYLDLLGSISSQDLRLAILNNYAYTEYYLGNTGTAIAALTRAQGSFPESPLICYNLALVYSIDGKGSLQEESLRDALRTIENTTDMTLRSRIYLETGLSAFRNGRNETAKRYFTKAHETDPGNNIAEYYLRQVWK